MGVCAICHEAIDPGKPVPGDDGLCPTCGALFQWFLSLYADVEFLPKGGWITAETTFHELSADSLDYVELVLEAEEEFGVKITDLDAERMQSVGDYLRYIHFHRKSISPKLTPVSQNPLWDRELDQ
jgi:acyl carrier protein